MAGGVSAVTTYMEVSSPGGAASRYVMRRHGEADRKRDPHIARHEFKLLKLLHSRGVRVAEPVMADESGELFPEPYIVAAFVEGETAFEPADPVHAARLLAEQLAAIHRIDCSRTEVPHLSDIYDRAADNLRARPEQLDDSLGEDLIRAKLEPVWPKLSRNAGAILHGDFWPGNVLWKDGRIAAVIDWEDAAWGDPLSDVGNARLELLWAYGAEAKDAFTERYRERMPELAYDALPYWDLYAALRPASQLSHWGLPPDTEARMRQRHAEFVRQAMGKARS
nr:phosphotransferase [Paenibacillus soyae]